MYHVKFEKFENIAAAFGNESEFVFKIKTGVWHKI